MDLNLNAVGDGSMLNYCARVVVGKDFTIVVAFAAHNGSAYLTKAYTVSPSLAVEDERVIRLFHFES